MNERDRLLQHFAARDLAEYERELRRMQAALDRPPFAFTPLGVVTALLVVGVTLTVLVLFA